MKKVVIIFLWIVLFIGFPVFEGLADEDNLKVRVIVDGDNTSFNELVKHHIIERLQPYTLLLLIG